MRFASLLTLVYFSLPAIAADAPPLEDVVKVFDASDGKQVGLAAMLDTVQDQEVVFVGETHLDETTHRLELAILAGLLERREGKVVLAMEMFERDVQPVLDDYLAGKIPEREFRKKARAWQNYETGYRDLVELAKARKVPVIASNAPAMLRRKVGFGGQKVLDSLPEQQRAWLPKKLYPNSEFYWDRFSRVVRGHMDMIVGNTPERRLTSGQSLWDNTMGESCVLALEEYPDHLVLHINGGFHSQYREGAASQVLARRPETKLTVLDIVPVTDLPGVREWSHPKRADFLLAADARAAGPSEGFHKVTINPELRYRLYVPPMANDEMRAPLLIWLCDDGLRARDGIRRWRLAFGESVAIAAVEPPYPQLEADLSLGGRWFWDETFMEDLGTLESGLARLWGYLLRNLPVDAERVVLAGEGSGATIVAAAALYSRGIDASMLAVTPRRYDKLHTMALPGPFGEDEQATRKLELILHPDDTEWWTKEAAEHKRALLDTTTIATHRGWWDTFLKAESVLRERFGLDPLPEGDGSALVMDVPGDSIRARVWTLHVARRTLGNGTGVRVSGPDAEGGSGEAFVSFELHPSALADGKAIPRASGPFGGTTILFVPKGAGDREAWQKLEDDKVLRSRFHHLRVVFEGDETDNLIAALEEVKAKGRRSVLVVPALFCADGDRMRALRNLARAYEDDMAIEWLPGFGGSSGLFAPSDDGGGEK
jgi:uncharacterized iron-regulated protein